MFYGGSGQLLTLGLTRNPRNDFALKGERMSGAEFARGECPRLPHQDFLAKHLSVRYIVSTRE